MENFKITATLNENNKFYEHFGIRESLANLYGNKPEDIVKLEMHVSEDQSIPPSDQSTNADYWGWYDFDKKNFLMIYGKRFLLEMCFPHGLKATEEQGKGKAYRLKIVPPKRTFYQKWSKLNSGITR